MNNISENGKAEARITALHAEISDRLNAGSPDYVSALREASIAAFARLGVPGYKSEDYRYTDLRKLFETENYKRSWQQPAFDFPIGSIFSCDVPEIDTTMVYTLNGWYHPQNDTLQLPDGVVLKSMQRAVTENREQVEPLLGKIASSADPLSALNGAFMTDGIFLYIPEKVVLEKPIQIVNILYGEENLYVTQRNLIIAGARSEAKLLFCDHTLSSSSFIFSNLTEMAIDRSAVMDYYTTQNLHNGTAHLNGMFVKMMEDSNLVTNTISLHGGLIRNHLSVAFAGKNAECNLFGLALTDRNQHVDNFVEVDHAFPHCRSNQIFKNILDDHATGAFTGKIDVRPYATKTEAFQRNNSVLLTKAARMFTKPQLVIDNDDVKCSHGATVGQVNEEALFYLQTRGINEKEARLMLMFAFAHEVLANIRFVPLRQSIDALVNKRLRGEVSRCHDCKIECVK